MPVDQSENKSKKMDKYLNFAGELKKLRNMRMMVIPIIVGVLGMVPKSLLKKKKKKKQQADL